MYTNQTYRYAYPIGLWKVVAGVQVGCIYLTWEWIRLEGGLEEGDGVVGIGERLERKSGVEGIEEEGVTEEGG